MSFCLLVHFTIHGFIKISISRSFLLYISSMKQAWNWSLLVSSLKDQLIDRMLNVYVSLCHNHFIAYMIYSFFIECSLSLQRMIDGCLNFPGQLLDPWGSLSTHLIVLLCAPKSYSISTILMNLPPNLFFIRIYSHMIGQKTRHNYGKIIIQSSSHIWANIHAKQYGFCVPEKTGIWLDNHEARLDHPRVGKTSQSMKNLSLLDPRSPYLIDHNTTSVSKWSSFWEIQVEPGFP